ncbi:hypothetical protein L3Q82_023979, partial [Scortum barcoo]
PSMHGLPCSSLGHCFGNPSDVNTDPAPAQETNSSRLSRNNHRLPAVDPVISQPQALPGSTQEEPHKQPQRTVSCISTHSTRTRKVNGTNSNSICYREHLDEDPGFESPQPCHSFSPSSEDDELDFSPELELKYPQIPRPSIIIRQPKEFQETASDRSDGRETEDGGLSDPCDPGLSLSPGRSVMAEPDYLEGDCDELIKPKKLINPVKSSRNHQDLHRELLMNQKRGLAPQNKPELQKVLEKRKREQVLKAQKEEQEAHKKRSDLEIELMKRQQKLEQLELEQQKIEEEQENTPEFVKMKSNLRRTKQETDGEERTT